MQKIKLFLLMFSLCFVACSEKENYDKNIEISIQAYNSILSSKVAISDSDLTTVSWAIGDNIYLWADNSSSEPVLENQAFTLKYYGNDYSTATFTTNVSEYLADENHTYYGVYPKPKSYSSKNVVMNIANTQTGDYDGLYDILLAKPISAAALEQDPLRDAFLSFRHLTHALRINIPENKNYLNDAVTKLVITFPCDVVGDLSFSVDDYYCTPTITNGSNVITLNLSEPLDAGGDYVWVFINATEQVEGDITFKAYSQSGYISEDIATYYDGSFAQGKITPIKLTIPQEIERTKLKFNIDYSKLGEAINSISFAPPSGVDFLDLDEGDKITVTSSQDFTLEYYGQFVGDALEGTVLDATFYSNNATVSDTINLKSTWQTGETNEVKAYTPYLYFEDFALLQDYDYNSTDNLYDFVYNPDASEVPGVTGYTAARSAGSAGLCLCIVGHTERNSSLSSTLNYKSRMDSGTMSNLNSSSTSVKLSITFDFGGKSTGSTGGSPKLEYGTTTTSGGLNGEQNITGSSSFTVSTYHSDLNGSYTNTPASFTYTKTGCSNATRLSFKADAAVSASSWTYNNFYYVYIDNIRVSITN